MRRLIPLCLLLLTAACAHTKEAKPSRPPISPEAAGFFGRAAAIDTVGSVVIDFDELRNREFITPSAERSIYVDTAINLLSTAGSVLKEKEAGPLLARGAIVLSLLREWNAWPSVQRVGVMLPWLKHENPAESLLLVLAVPNNTEQNLTLLKGLAAADRATGQPLFAMREGRLCLAQANPVGAGAICGIAGPGYILFANVNALEELTKPTTAPLPPPSFFRIHANVPTFGRGDVVSEWKNGVLTTFQVVTPAPGQAEKIERILQEGLKKLDEHNAETHSFLAPLVERTKQSLANDPEAPAELKAVAQKITTNTLVDPQGFYDEIRKSITVTRADNQVTASATVPEHQVRQALKQQNLLVTTAAVGVLAAIAVPNFMKFQKRSKQSEVRANLKAAFTAQRAYYMEYDRYGKTFEEIGFMPEKGNRYMYCMAGRCIPCTATDCYMPPPKQNPCIEMTQEYANDDGTEGFLVCAVGDPKGNKDPDELDLWTITEDGEPQPLTGAD